jgi:hypothetical protein
MIDAIKSSILLSMADSLELVELGAATRILARLIEKKGPLPRRTAHLVAGVSKEDWNAMEASVLACFAHTDTDILLGSAAHPIPAVASEAKPQRKGKTAPLFPTQDPSHKPTQLPRYLAQRPKGVTIKQAVYDTGLRLLMAKNMTEKVARSILANLLATYPAGDVASAIEAAQAQPTLADPHSWIVANLRQKAQGARIRVRPGQSPDREQRVEGISLAAATESRLNGSQMSLQTIKAIQDRNQSLSGLRLGLGGPSHSPAPRSVALDPTISESASATFSAETTPRIDPTNSSLPVQEDNTTTELPPQPPAS